LRAQGGSVIATLPAEVTRRLAVTAGLVRVEPSAGILRRQQVYGTWRRAGISLDEWTQPDCAGCRALWSGDRGRDERGRCHAGGGVGEDVHHAVNAKEIRRAPAQRTSSHGDSVHGYAGPTLLSARPAIAGRARGRRPSVRCIRGPTCHLLRGPGPTHLRVDAQNHRSSPIRAWRL
jgi:hypothetical protein